MYRFERYLHAEEAARRDGSAGGTILELNERVLSVLAQEWGTQLAEEAVQRMAREIT